MSEVTTTTVKEQAEYLLTMASETETKRAAFIETLIAQRQSINEALVTLGAKRARRKVAEPKKRGRPPGSRNVAKSAPMIDAPNAAAGENL